MSEWQKLADAAGVRWCPGCIAIPDPVPGHVHGRALYERKGKPDIVIHWIPRRVTRSGMVRFLRIIVRRKRGFTGPIEKWWQIYELDHEVQQIAKMAGFRFRREMFDLNRARLRYALGEITIQERRTWPKKIQDEYGKALRWAARL